MQSVSSAVMSSVDARVEEVHPKLGLAYVVDEAAHSWGVSRSVSAEQFDALTPGQRVRLQVQQYASFSVVRECRLLG